MAPLAGQNPPAWCDRHECLYYGRSCPICEAESEDYHADMGDGSI